jgi:hypothetical protein
MKTMTRCGRANQLVIVHEILSIPFPSPPIHTCRILAKQVSKTTKPNRLEKQTPRPLPGITSNSFLREQWENRKRKKTKSTSTLRHPLPSTRPSHLFQKTLYSYRCICIRETSSCPFVRNFPSLPILPSFPPTRRSDFLSKIVSILLWSYALELASH